MSVKIITDSISDISAEVAEHYDIDVLPIGVTMGANTVKDDENFSASDMVSWSLYNKEFPKFRGISTETYKQVFEKYAAQNRDILVITADSKTISNYDCAMHAGTSFGNIKIEVIDSLSHSAALAVLVLKAADMAMAGESLNGIAIQIEKLLLRPEMHTMFDNIDMFRLTSACPSVLKMGETILNRKYHFTVVEGRKYDVAVLPSSGSKAVERYCNSVFKEYEKINKERLIIMKTYGSDEYFTYVHNYVLGLNYFEDIVVLPSGAYSTALAGEKGVGVGFTKRIS